MLDIRPNCENCNKDLPPNSTEAMICSFECTFCADCASKVLLNVCPNCGGGFTPRPIRPKKMLYKHPASTKRVTQKIDPQKHAEYAVGIKDIKPEDR